MNQKGASGRFRTPTVEEIESLRLKPNPATKRNAYDDNTRNSSANIPASSANYSGRSNAIIVNPVQRGNPILAHVRNVTWEYGDIVPDYLVGRSACVIFLSLRYHKLHPEYVYNRIDKLKRDFALRILLVQVDTDDHKGTLRELNKAAILSDVTLFLAWSSEEAGRYLETFKAYEHKSHSFIQERVEADYPSQLTKVLTQVKSVNSTDAKTLSSVFGSLHNLADATKEELLLCPGFGSLKAKRLHDALNQSFLANSTKNVTQKTLKGIVKEKDGSEHAADDTNNRQTSYTTSTSTTSNGSIDFINTGIDPTIAKAAKDIYNVETPTRLQKLVIKRMISPQRDVMIRQETGTGKTFAMLLSSLTIALRKTPTSNDAATTNNINKNNNNNSNNEGLKVLMVVPSRELALQINSWAMNLLNHQIDETQKDRYRNIIKTIVSGEGFNTKGQLAPIKSNIPKILVGTPKVLLELFSDSKFRNSVAIPKSLELVVIDEVDHILRLPSKNAPLKKKILRKEKPKPGQQLIDNILLNQSIVLKSKKKQDIKKKNKNHQRKVEDNEDIVPNNQRPYLIMSSATSNRDLRLFIKKKGWTRDGKEPRLISLPKTNDINNTTTTTSNTALSTLVNGKRYIPLTISHSCLVIEKDGNVHNLRRIEEIKGYEAATQTQTNNTQDVDEFEEFDLDASLDQTDRLDPNDPSSSQEPPIPKDSIGSHYENKEKWIESMCEAVSNILAAENTSGTTLIFVRTGLSTQQFMGCLYNDYGVECHELLTMFRNSNSCHLGLETDYDESVGFDDGQDLSHQPQAVVRQQQQQQQKVLVTTEQMARGIDIPNVSLVLVLDLPESIASYIHMAGRTGRFGREGGKVISIVPSGKRNRFEGRMRGLYKIVNVKPTRLDYVCD
ncbi:ssDNA endonuclease and repair protein rad10 [Mycoemilia scoparia]|uniref:DNA excision repair protein ERCC-1 n=1 Tax=Mycoemilia scoparia TaxID=417184 RepID=A0A9W7ZTU5_9FUNG|nr:ssDNA endonuclease and repair protein rad10 [Mycoemilia scoparia]